MSSIKPTARPRLRLSNNIAALAGYRLEHELVKLNENKPTIALAAMFSLVILACGGNNPGSKFTDEMARRYIIWNTMDTGSPAVRVVVDGYSLQDLQTPPQTIQGQVGLPSPRSQQYQTDDNTPVTVTRADTGVAIATPTIFQTRSDRQVIVTYGTPSACQVLFLPFSVSRQEAGKRIQLTVAHTLSPIALPGTPNTIDVHVVPVGGTPTASSRVLDGITHFPPNESILPHKKVDDNFNGTFDVVLTGANLLNPWIRVQMTFVNGTHYFIALGKDGTNAKAYSFSQTYGTPAP
jgi:hypothetical protein